MSFNQVTALHLKIGYISRRFHLRESDLRMSCCDLTTVRRYPDGSAGSDSRACPIDEGPITSLAPDPGIRNKIMSNLFSFQFYVHFGYIELNTYTWNCTCICNEISTTPFLRVDVSWFVFFHRKIPIILHTFLLLYILSGVCPPQMCSHGE